MKKEYRRRVLIIVITAVVTCSLLLSTVVLANNNWSFSELVNSFSNQTPTGKEVGDYSSYHGEISGEKIKLEDPELEEKSWYEYIDYVFSYKTEPDENNNTYKVYSPADIGIGSVMAIRDYNPDNVDNKVSVGVTWSDISPLLQQVVVANMGVYLTNGLYGVYGGVSQGVLVNSIWTSIAENNSLLNESKYYATPSFMGIPGDKDWGGISNEGFYNSSSLTVSMAKTSQYNVQKTNTVSSAYTVSGSISVKVGILKLADLTANGSISSGLNYGLNFQQGQSINNSETVSRTFSARTDDEVKNVAWKLCEYKVIVPFYVEQYDGDGNFVTDAYVEYTYLNGVCRVFANGYIEHWNTGKLVSYGDFFSGFKTATEIVDMAKSGKTISND